MPYIEEPLREKWKFSLKNLTGLSQLGGQPPSAGEINYVISKWLWFIFDRFPSYTMANTIVGILECVKQEFIRRKLNPYENEKLKKNGDI